MAAAPEDRGDAGERDRHAHRSDRQELPPADAVDQAHRENREQEVGGPDRDGLEVARELVEPCAREDVVQVVENGVDPGELVEHRDRDR